MFTAIADVTQGLGVNVSIDETHITVRVVEVEPREVLPPGVQVVLTLPRTPAAERVLGAALNAVGENQYALQAALYLAATKAGIAIFPPSPGALCGGLDASPPPGKKRKRACAKIKFPGYPGT